MKNKTKTGESFSHKDDVFDPFEQDNPGLVDKERDVVLGEVSRTDDSGQTEGIVLDDDRWELGERGRSPRTPLIASAGQRRRRMPLLVLLGLVFLGVGGWVWRSSFQPPLASSLPTAVLDPQPVPAPAVVERSLHVPAVTPPSPSVSPPLPTNTPPQITQRFPTEKVVAARLGETLQFSALALDPDGESVSYAWSVDGKHTVHGEHFSYEVGSTGEHRVELEASDQGGLKSTFRWEVQVATPPAAPQLTMYTPHQESVALFPHFSRFFGVEVEVPGMVEPSIRYEWEIDNRFAGEQELLEIKNLAPGRHEVEVAATGPSGASIFHRWTVNIQDQNESEEMDTVEPPRLVVSELDNDLSTDKKQVLVKGRIRNIGKREVSNMIAWVSALDSQQKTVVRRLVLPTPQPLVPDQVATLQAVFNNRSDIVDFHVEVVSK